MTFTGWLMEGLIYILIFGTPLALVICTIMAILEHIRNRKSDASPKPESKPSVQQSKSNKITVQQSKVNKATVQQSKLNEVPVQKPKDKVRDSRLYKDILRYSRETINNELKVVIPKKVENLAPSKWYSYVHITINEKDCNIYNNDRLEKDYGYSRWIEYQRAEQSAVQYEVKYLYNDERIKFREALEADLKKLYPSLEVEQGRNMYDNLDPYSISVGFPKNEFKKYERKDRF